MPYARCGGPLRHAAIAHAYTGTHRWRRSRSCADGGCAEVARCGDEVLVRSSRRTDIVVRLSHDEWEAFREAMRAADFDDI
jgi:Domain of unknown function (DUF397)